MGNKFIYSINYWLEAKAMYWCKNFDQGKIDLDFSSYKKSLRQYFEEHGK
ncbi:hypothetical protein ASZ90_017361 [hydrocarbon metagenome]|uniref:Uncharacterized protein n=1 Tax=hydrocarbon metagenome TaxID=938273 RepID=A0A0W8E9S0_9ZZZZ